MLRLVRPARASLQWRYVASMSAGPSAPPEALPSIKAELGALFSRACDGLSPSIVEVNNRPDADFALTTAMEMFRKNKNAYPSAKDAANAIIERVGGARDERFSLSQANFYVNIKLSEWYLSDRVNQLLSGGQLIPPPEQARKRERVLIDFSSPNIAKQMHVGHLRSTVIGNSLAKLHEFVGHETIRVNHLGDWGTQFGTLLAHILDIHGESAALDNVQKMTLAELTKLYQDSKQRLDAEPDFAQRAKATTVKLQSARNSALNALWKTLVTISIADFDRMYSRLNIPRSDDWYLGESFYQDKVEAAISDLKQFCTTSQTDSSVLLFTGIPEARFKKEDKVDEVPLILRKSDGGIGYDATDVAAIRYRLKSIHAEKLLYVTDSGQSLHFSLVFHAAKLAGWTKLRADMEASLHHVAFGVVRKASGGRIKTREAGAQTLDSLLDQAIERTFRILESKRKDRWTAQELETIRAIAHPLGVASVVFSELKTNRSNDYEFNVARMCNPDGDSALYLMHVLQKIRRLGLPSQSPSPSSGSFNLNGASPKERALALNVAKFHDVVEASLSQLAPHLLCTHALSVAGDVSSFLEELGPREKASDRPLLVRAAERVILQELSLLGLGPFVEQMRPVLDHVASWRHVELL